MSPASPSIDSLERAQKAGIPAIVLRKKDFDTQEAYDAALIQTLENAGIGLVVMAGFLTIIGEQVIRKFENRILNIHPFLTTLFLWGGFLWTARS